MRLPTDKLIHVLGHSSVKFTNGGSKRQVGRIPLTLEATLRRLTPKSLSAEIKADLTDLSIFGVGLIHSEKLFPREKFTLCIRRDGQVVLQVQCAVTRCTRKSEARYQIGAEYIALVEEELAARPIAAGNEAAA